MNHGSLFSGIGGFDLAAEWMGWKNKFHCEWNPFGQKVLKHYWPKAESYEDITKTDFTLWRAKIDIISGGFPCQPYSMAGKRLGKEDDRHLWPEMLRAIREIQPRYVVGENVSGLINWNGGMVFDEVQSELETEGYEVRPFILPAASVGAPHQRQRVWFIAYSSSNGYDAKSNKTDNRIRKDNKQSGTQRISTFERFSDERIITNTESVRGSKGFGKNFNCNRWDSKEYFTKRNSIRDRNSSISGTRIFKQATNSDFRNFPTQSPVCYGNDGLSSRLDGITFSKWRNESIKAGGNAIVPQVAFQIFQAIQEFQNKYGH